MQPAAAPSASALLLFCSSSSRACSSGFTPLPSPILRSTGLIDPADFQPPPIRACPSITQLSGKYTCHLYTGEISVFLFFARTSGLLGTCFSTYAGRSVPAKSLIFCFSPVHPPSWHLLSHLRRPFCTGEISVFLLFAGTPALMALAFPPAPAVLYRRNLCFSVFRRYLWPPGTCSSTCAGRSVPAKSLFFCFSPVLPPSWHLLFHLRRSFCTGEISVFLLFASTPGCTATKRPPLHPSLPQKQPPVPRPALPQRRPPVPRPALP